MPWNGTNTFLQQFFALPNKPPFSVRTESTGAHGHYRNIHSTAACPGRWQLYNLGAIGYVAMLQSAVLCWRFQHGMPSNWCNPPCFAWKVGLFVKFRWSPMKETCILQALLGHSDSWWEAATCPSETHPWATCRALTRRKQTFSWNQPKLLPNSLWKEIQQQKICQGKPRPPTN